MNDVSESIGELRARVAGLEADMAEVRADVKQILQHVSAAKGGWRTLVVLGTIVTAIGGGFAWLVSFLRHP